MRTLELGKYQRARVWIGELPNVACPPVKTLTHTIVADSELQHGLRLAAVELLIVTGPRSIYGLLGGQWKPDATGELSIEISISGANERLLVDNLAMKGDEVRVGLPAEYANANCEGSRLESSQSTVQPMEPSDRAKQFTSILPRSWSNFSMLTALSLPTMNL